MRDIEICKKIMKNAGKTYFFATKVFPAKIRNATYALYAFYRVPDDIVDLNEDLPVEARRRMLKEWTDKWSACIDTKGKSDEAVLRSAYKVHIEYGIDFKYSADFLQAMDQDLDKSRYRNYAELEKYMYGSAAVVGIMMTFVIGQRKLESPTRMTLAYAEKLGYAMQITNFLRDIHEDIDERNRIYMPEDEYKIFEIEEIDFIKHKYPEKWNDFLELQLHRAERLYREADQGIKQLNWYGRFAVRLASRLYEEYHKEIRKSEYKVFHNKYSISTARRITILLKSIFI
jgi:phytoene synthase